MFANISYECLSDITKMRFAKSCLFKVLKLKVEWSFLFSFVLWMKKNKKGILIFVFKQELIAAGRDFFKAHLCAMNVTKLKGCVKSNTNFRYI